MKKIIFLFIFYCNSLYAQNTLVKDWDYRYGGTDYDGVRGIIQANDKGFIIAGTSFSRLNGDLSEDNRDIVGYSNDYWIIKTDSFGIKQWDKRFGGKGYDYFRFISKTSDGGYIVGGFSDSDKNGDYTQSSRGGFDYWIIKIDSSGNKQWDRRYGGASSDKLWVVNQTKDGGYILGGYSSSDSSGDRTESSWGGQDYWIVKTDSFGNKQWDKRYGGGASDILYSMVQMNDGGYLLGGFSSHGIDGDYSHVNHGNNDYWIVKTDSNGTKQWDNDYGGLSHDELYTITKTNDGYYILGGTSSSNVSGNKTDSLNGIQDYWVVKIDSAGNKIWDKSLGGRGGDEKIGNITQTTDNGFLVAGISRSIKSADKSEDNLGLCQPWIVKIDNSGNLEWDKTIFVAGDNCITAGGYAIQTGDHCFVSANSVDGGIGGYKTQPNWDPNDSLYDIWIVKFCDTSLFTPVYKMLAIQNQLSVYPIPFLSEINIQLEKGKIKLVKITIKNILGETVYFDLSNNTDKTFFKNIDLSFLSNGFYLLEMDFDGERIVRKLLKE